MDSNSCGTVQQDDLQQCKDQQNNKNRSVPCIIIFCNGIQVGTLCIDFLNFSSKKSLTTLSVHDKITFDFERQSIAESLQSNLPWTPQRGKGHTDSRVPSRPAAQPPLLIERSSSNFISWFLYNHEIAQSVCRLVKRSIKSSKSRIAI